MKKTLLSAIAVSALLSLVVAGVQTGRALHTQDEQDHPFIITPISIASSSNTIYSSNLLTLNVTTQILLHPRYSNISYSIDGKNNVSLPLTTRIIPKPAGPFMTYSYVITGLASLQELPEGPHNVTVYQNYTVYEQYTPYGPNGTAYVPPHETDTVIELDSSMVIVHSIVVSGVNNVTVNAKYQANNVFGLDSSTVYFTLNDGAPPSISNLSLENKTYSQVVLPLSFITDEPTSWIGYSLDNQANITTDGNTTLTDLTDGVHRLVIFANDTAGNIGKSDTVYFTVDTQPSPSASPTPTAKPSTSPIPSETPSPFQPPSPLSPIGDSASPFPALPLFIALAVTAVVIITVIVAARKKR